MELADVVGPSHPSVQSCEAVPTVRVAGTNDEDIGRNRLQGERENQLKTLSTEKTFSYLTAVTDLSIECSVHNNLFKETQTRGGVHFIQEHLWT